MLSKVNTPEGREWVINTLKQGPTTVVFTKKDGTIREMICTLKPELTESYEKKTDRVKETNPDVCPVYDLDAKGWRSFRFDSIKSMELN